MYVSLGQVCNIFRPSQAVSGGRKSTDEDPMVADIECNIHPISDSTLVATMGATATEFYRGLFPSEVELMQGDTVVLKTESDDLVFRVEGEMTFRGAGLDGPYVVEANLVRTKIR